MSPARASDCRKCDSLLVPYCDHELDSKLRDWVDEHVVNCKRCGIELSCVELESLRLREALVPMEPSLDFVNSVMDRVRDVVATEASVEPPSSVTGSDFTSRVLNQVRRDLGEPDEALGSSRRPSSWGPSRIAVALLAAAVLVAALTLPFLVNDPVEPKAAAGTWFVVRAENAGPLRVGDALRLPLRETLRGGVLEIENGNDGAGWKLGVEGDGRVTVLSADRVRLEDGEISAATTAPRAPALAIELPGGHVVTLASGRFDINVEDVADRSPMPGLDRISVRVHEGSADFRTRGSELLVPLPSGSLALLEPLRPLQIQALPSTDSLARLLETEVRGGPARSTDESKMIVVRGYVRGGQAGGVVPGAVVALHAGERVAKATSKADGSYELRLPLEDATSDEFWVSAAAPAGRMDLGDLSFRTLRDVLSAGETHFEDLRLASVQARRGRLLGLDGAAVVGARIRALRIDGFFGSARLLPGVETRSAQDGAFLLPGLPPERAGETTALLIEPASGRAAPHVEYGITSGNDASPLLVRVQTGSLAEVPVQDPATRIVWVEKRPAGIAGAYWRSIERLEVPAAGRRTVQTLLTRGSTLRWWEDAGTGRPSRGHEGDPLWASPSEVAILGAEPPRSLGRDGLVAELPSADSTKPIETVAFAPIPGLSSLGFGRDAPRPRASRARRGAPFSELELRVLDAEVGVSIEAARVYVRVADGPAWFAGFTDLDGRLVVRDLPRGVAVRAIAFAGRGVRLLGAKRVIVDEARERHRVAMTAVRAVETAVPLTAANSCASVRIFDGPFDGYEVCTRVGADGSLRLGDLPPGAVRIQVADRETVVAPDGTQVSDWQAWRPSQSEDGR